MSVISGQTTVTIAGTAVQLSTDKVVNGPVMVKALPANTGYIYIGQVSGGVTSANGLVLAAGDSVIFSFVGNLNEIWIDSSVNSKSVAWLMLNI